MTNLAVAKIGNRSCIVFGEVTIAAGATEEIVTADLSKMNFGSIPNLIVELIQYKHNGASTFLGWIFEEYNNGIITLKLFSSKSTNDFVFDTIRFKIYQAYSLYVF